MMEESLKVVVDKNLRLLSWSGMNPFKFQILTFISYFCLLSTMILAIIGLICDDLTWENAIAYINTTMGLLNVVTKLAGITLNRKDLRVFFNNMNNYWPIDNPKYSEEFKQECSNKIKAHLKIIKAYQFYMVYLFFSIIFMEIYNDILPYPMYQPKILPPIYYKILSNISFYLCLPIAVASDFLLSTMFRILGLQFQFLNESLRISINECADNNLNEEEINEMIKRHVHHHNFLLDQFSLVNKTFGATLLVYLWNEVIIMCFFFFATTQVVNNAEGARYILYILIVISQMFIFVAQPAEYLTTQATNLNLSIYDSKWYELNHSVRKSLTIMMSRTQIDIHVSAGKLMYVNVATCTQLYKSALSFTTVLKNIMNK